MRSDLKSSKWSNHTIVISRYNEKDIKWLNNLGDFPDNSIYIYNKNDGLYKEERYLHNYKLPNIGKCDHTYLAYIIEQYHNLKEYTLFTSPDYQVHSQSKIYTALKFFEKCNKVNAHYKKDVYFAKKCKKVNFFCKDYRINNFGWKDLSLNKDNITFGEWVKKYIEPNFERFVRKNGAFVNFGGTFCVRKANILSRNLSFYKQLIGQFDSNDSEVAHFFERAWYYIFNIHLKIS